VPFFFLFVGLGLLVIAIKGTQKQAGALLKSEFTGAGSYVPWATAVFVIGGLGYVPVIKKPARALMLLVLLVLFLTKGKGFFDSFRSQISGAQNVNVNSLPGATGAGSSAIQSATGSAGAPAAGTVPGTPSVALPNAVPGGGSVTLSPPAVIDVCTPGTPGCPL